MLRRHRLPLVALGVLALGGMLAGCAPDPAPTPSPTPAFASDEEAFAAAEEVYRAYNDAVNAQRAGDESADPTEYLVGAALEADLDSDQLIAEQGWTLVGDGVVTEFTGIEAKLDLPVRISASACLDASATAVLDQDGADVTPVDRPTRVQLALTFVEAGATLAIAQSEVAEDPSC